MVLKLGSTGEDIRRLQVFLGLVSDGIFGLVTEKAVMEWQRVHGLVVDGIVGNRTWGMMGIATTDVSEVSLVDGDFVIHPFYLSAGQYFSGPYPKDWVFMHHTAGWHSPYDTIRSWGSDNRGEVATEFVIGGQSVKGGDNRSDGILVQSFPAGGYGWHLGTGRSTMHSDSVGIELCNFGQLTMGGYYDRNYKWVSRSAGICYTYVGVEVDDSQVVTLAKSFRGFNMWHRYSDKQISILKDLLLYIGNRDGIDMRDGLVELIKDKGAEYAFDFCDINYVMKRPGLWTHANVISTKVDVFPQVELIDMLMSL